MKIKIQILTSTFTLFLLCVSAFADSLPIKNGRYSGGTAITIQLTESQQKHIKKSYKPYSKMSLTKTQQKEIAKKAKMKEPPTKLTLMRPADTVGECTCGLANIGLIISERIIEIPVSYLATDKIAREMAIEIGLEE